MKTAVKVRRGGHLVTYHKKGSKAYLCTPRKIRIKGKTFTGRLGGRTLCGPSTGKNTKAARDAREAFTKMVKSHKRRVRRHSRRRSRR